VHFTVATEDENAWSTNNYLLKLKVKVMALYFGVLCLNFNYFYMTNSYFCTTSLLNVHKQSKLNVGRVRNSGSHVLKTILVVELFNCVFSSSSSGFQIFLIRQKGDLIFICFFLIFEKNGKRVNLFVAFH